MSKRYISCGFSEAEVLRIDQLVTEGIYTSRSDAVRLCTIETMNRRVKNDRIRNKKHKYG